MHLTTKGKYAVTAVLDLASSESRFCNVALTEVAERQKIPAPYLEQLFRNLRRAGILRSTRGPKGGFRLARSRKDISIGEIISAVEKRMDATQCGGEKNCVSGSRCLAHDLWTELNNKVGTFLLSKSLDDVLEKTKESNDVRELLIFTG